jgi:hypothetical protein
MIPALASRAICFLSRLPIDQDVVELASGDDPTPLGWDVLSRCVCGADTVLVRRRCASLPDSPSDSSDTIPLTVFNGDSVLFIPPNFSSSEEPEIDVPRDELSFTIGRNPTLPESSESIGSAEEEDDDVDFDIGRG